MCGERPADASSTLAAAASALGDPALAVTPASEEVYWILGQAPMFSIAAGARSDWPSRMLASSGYFVSRTRHGDHLILDAGAHGFLNGGHSHSDALAVVLTVGGDPVLVDPGTAMYTMNPALRDGFRSTRMHNTVVIDGRDHAEPRGPFRWHGAPKGVSCREYRVRGRLCASHTQRLSARHPCAFCIGAARSRLAGSGSRVRERRG